MSLYVGEPGYPGQQSERLNLRPLFLGECTPEERNWLEGGWFRTPAGSLRRDVCVAGHYLRIVLRPSPHAEGWNVGALALRMKDGEAYGKLWKTVVKEAASAAHASLAFFRLFQPGPAE